MKSLLELINVAHALADIAGEIARAYFRQPLSITLKTGNSPVTQADLEIETALRAYLQQHCPDHGILGEEYEEKQIDSEYVWVIDPIDGTAAFACGKPTFSTLIALLHYGTATLGIIDQPISRERWVGIINQPTTYNGVPCTSHSTGQALRLSCTTPAMFKTDKQKQQFTRLQNMASVVSYGGDGYAYGLLASGHINVICEADLKFYDVAALIPIIEGAGGFMGDWQGNPLNSKEFKGEVLAVNLLNLPMEFNEIFDFA